MILKAKQYFLGLLNREMYEHTFIKIVIVLFGGGIEKIVYLTELKKLRGVSNMLKIRLKKEKLGQKIR